MTDLKAIRIRVRERHLRAVKAVLERRGIVDTDVEKLRQKWQTTYDTMFASGDDPEAYVEQLRAEGMNEQEIIAMLVRQGKTGIRRNVLQGRQP